MRQTFKRQNGIINKIEHMCDSCGERFYDWPSNNRSYCSKECVNVGRTPWNKGRKHLAVAGENNPNWKGDGVGYSGVHMWLKTEKGKPSHCEHCGTTKGRLEWASVNGELKRDVENYISLCKPCHIRHDGLYVEEPSYHTAYMREYRKAVI